MKMLLVIGIVMAAGWFYYSSKSANYKNMANGKQIETGEQEKKGLKELQQLKKDINNRLTEVSAALKKGNVRAALPIQPVKEYVTARRVEIETSIDSLEKSTQRTWKLVKSKITHADEKKAITTCDKNNR